MLPKYITPGYSIQRAALELDSSVKYEYLQVVHSAEFFNKSFTISLWLKSDVHALVVDVVVCQNYRSAPNLFIEIINEYAELLNLKTFNGNMFPFCLLKAIRQWLFLLMEF